MSYQLVKDFKEVLGAHECFTIRGGMSPLLLSFPWQGENLPLVLFTISKGRDCFMALDEENYFEIARLRFEKYHKGELSLKWLQDEYYSFAAQMQDFYDKSIAQDFSKALDEELSQTLKGLLDQFLVSLQNTIYLECIDYDKILNVIGTDKKEELDVIWETATHPTFISFEGRRLKLLIDLVSSRQNNLIRKAKFIFTDYVWTKSDAEIETALADIRKNMKEKSGEYDNLEKSVAAKKAEYDTWKVSLNKDMQEVVEYMQMVMLFRDLRKDVIAQMQAVMVEVAVEMLKRIEVDAKHATNILIFECVKGIEYLKSIKDELVRRESGFISVVYTDFSYKIELCDFDKALDEFEKTVVKHVHTDTIKGFVANKGKLTGTVRVVLDPHGYKGFNKGDILVTSMTRPEFVPLMKQAGAVVTNEGGITCHAAIVSRELGIPCVIGTKIATRVLKDGDRVEVDADNGVVTILKKNE
ncbi:MAG: PEP-utilizing enzyme [Patescibacteria group bacterium]